MRPFITAAIVATIAAGAAVQPAHAEQIWVTMDQVRPYKLSRPAGQIVVGNPGIADVTVQDKSNLLLFGKAPGLTNIFIYDDDGEKIENLMIKVRTSSEMVTFQRGRIRTTLNCTTHCEPTVTIGDNQAVFAETVAQIQQKFGQAAASSGE